MAERTLVGRYVPATRSAAAIELSAVRSAMTVELSVAISVAAVVLVSVLSTVATVTVFQSVRAKRKRDRQDATQRELRGGLLERLYGADDPEWDEWVTSLSAYERDQLESLLAFYLRELDGSDATRLAGLGTALGIDDRSRRQLQSGDDWTRLHALTWLALLRDPPDRALLKRYCTETPRERATATRVLYLSDAPDLGTTGIELLLGDEPRSFSVFGIDTLYRVARAHPSILFERASADFDDWGPTLQQQVLLVVRYMETAIGTEETSWIVRALSSPHERVRAQAYRALEPYGWHRPVRDQLDVAAIAEEPSPMVRTNAYQLLGEWGDAAAIQTLASLAARETDDRAQVAAARELYPHRTRLVTELPASLGPAWEWGAEHARFDAIARDVSRSIDSYTQHLLRRDGP